MKIKNLFYSLGSVVIVTAPLFFVFSCGNSNGISQGKINDNNGEKNKPKKKTLINNEKEWIDFVNQQNWDDDFKSKALKSIDWWKSSGPLVKFNAFYKSSLPKDFIIPSSVTKIGPSAFRETTLPEGFTLPNGVKEIDAYCFFKGNLPKSFVLPQSLKIIKDWSFSQAILPESFTIPNGVTKIKNCAFYETKMPEGFRIPKSVIEMKDAFYDVDLENHLTWYDENNIEQDKVATPQPGWYIGKKK